MSACKSSGASASVSRSGTRMAGSRSGLSPALVLDNPDIGIVNTIRAGQLHKNALFHSGPQVSGKVFIQQPLGKRYKVVVNVTPVLFQVGIHAGKRAIHDRDSHG